MNYKTLVADIIAFSIKKVELAEFDLNITQEEEFEGEIKAHTQLLEHIDMMLSGAGKPDEELKHCTQLVNEVLEGLSERKGDEHLDRRK
jgi:hypothetical protein